MPRKAREKSESGIYHVLLRGINRETIFSEEEDCRKFLEVLAAAKEAGGFLLFGYCLMNNHIHLLVKEADEPLPQIIKRIGVRFVYWYNMKYGRSGPLFQDRYMSEPVESGRYFLTVLRFIHQNPQKAWLVTRPENYKFSSYTAYININSGLVDTSLALEMLDKESFVQYMGEISEERCLECGDYDTRLTDDEAKDIMKRASGLRSPEQVTALPKKDRDRLLAEFRAVGMSIRQISRLTGVGFGVIRKF